MPIKRPFTRRQALLMSSAGALGLALGGLPRLARSAVTGLSLPIPTLIDARNEEPVTLALQKSRHWFGSGAPVPSMGISSSYLGPVVRVRSGDTVSFRVKTALMKKRRCTGMASRCRRRWTEVRTIRSTRAPSGHRKSR